jgi:glycosyltransferase involved in cell wall biosynthesis
MNDYNIGLIAVLCRKVLRQKPTLVFDAHLLSDTWKDRFVLSHCDAIIATSLVLASHIKMIGIAESIISTVLGGVNLDAYQKLTSSDISKLRKSLNIENSSRIIGYVGGFTTMGMDKGLGVLIEAFKYLPIDYSLLLVGGNKRDFEEYQTLVAKKGLQNRCMLVGQIDSETVPLYQMVCDILVIPYPDKPHFSRYGFPMKVFEYLATNKTVVYSNLKIISDVLHQYPQCHAFMADEVQSLVSTIQTVQKSLENSTMSIEQFSWNEKAKNIISIISKL